MLQLAHGAIHERRVGDVARERLQLAARAPAGVHVDGLEAVGEPGDAHGTVRSLHRSMVATRRLDTLACMTDRDITDPDIEAYATAHTTPEPAYLTAVEADTRARLPRIAGMLTGRLEGRFLTMLAAMLGARRILEIGTFTGYSALSMAEGMADGGTLITCEIDPRHAAVARANIAASPHAGRIEVRDGPALDTMRALEGPFDLIFIDADKEGYPAYYDEALRLLAPQRASSRLTTRCGAAGSWTPSQPTRAPSAI